MPAQVKLSELSAEVRKQLGVKSPRRRSLSLDNVRTHAIRVLAVIAELTPSERARVLRQAGRMNDL
jgi:hypothetical protein